MGTQWRANRLSIAAEGLLGYAVSCWEIAEDVAVRDVSARPAPEAEVIDQVRSAFVGELDVGSSAAFDLQKRLAGARHTAPGDADPAIEQVRAVSANLLHEALAAALRVATVARAAATTGVATDLEGVRKLGNDAVAALRAANEALLQPLAEAQVAEAGARLKVSREEARKLVNERWE